MSYDKSLKRLEEIVTLLEKGETGMDDLSNLVKEASALVKECKSKLRMTEEEIGRALSDEPEA
ncbi:exodeoxyribonuclease VII small subunit [Fontibacter flavus]|uniref:Exodeoxyribonuclease VII small subunit n=1 Tax=Fontibacter flavus TaxID=654838 RepID=A0ABV6FUZ0_9BACT|nr:exodeoxyribonuclease VII small subunit [Cyclobacteriaceae bacterium]